MARGVQSGLTMPSRTGKVMLKRMTAFVTSGAIALGTFYTPATAADAKFGPSNPFYAPSTLPFHAPPFDKIKDEDYQPAIEAGMAEEIAEIQAIADNPAAPTFENTLVAMEKTGQLLRRALAAFGAVSAGEYQSRAAESASRRGAEAGSAPRCHLPERKTLCARGCRLQAARVAQARSGVAAAARGHLRQVRPLWRKPFGRGQSRVEEAERGNLDALE